MEERMNIEQAMDTIADLFEMGHYINEQIKSEKRYNWSLESIGALIRDKNQIEIEITAIENKYNI
jgi:hypothetical protein